MTYIKSNKWTMTSQIVVIEDRHHDTVDVVSLKWAANHQLVMFFVFHVLILTVLQVSKINSFVAVAEVQPDGES